MADFLISMAISVILTTLKEAIKNPEKKAALKRAMLKIRDNINVVYPED